ncbi:MAG: D-alanyl-D-alanine carboxypeptidase, partial [Sphingomonas sp.]|nr:D-alanyl-D-alanine carboxypeptidase [Sphingomonas sp.]
AKVETAEVQLGATNSVGLVAPRDLAITLPGGPTPELTLKVVYSGPIKAPIKAGQHIADLVVTAPGLPQQSLPLVAQSDVAEAGFFGRAWAGFWSLFGM